MLRRPDPVEQGRHVRKTFWSELCVSHCKSSIIQTVNEDQVKFQICISSLWVQLLFEQIDFCIRVVELRYELYSVLRNL